MHIRCWDKQSMTKKSGVVLSFANINNVSDNICCQDKEWLFITSNIEPFSLSYRIKMGAIMLSDYLSVPWFIWKRGT